MIIEYSKCDENSIPARELKANTLYDFVVNDDVSRVLVSDDFKAIEFYGGNIVVWHYNDIREETGFSGKFFLSDSSLTLKN
jgi:hypothetical protein